MVRTARGLLMLAVCLAVEFVATGAGRAQELPPAPVPISPGPTVPRLGDAQSWPAPGAAPLPALPPIPAPVPGAPTLTGPPPAPLPGPPPGSIAGPPGCAPNEDCNGPLLRGDPLLDWPQSPPPGWFVGLDIGIIKPHIKNDLMNTVRIAGFLDQVRLPIADLDWTGAPRVEIGYRFAQGFGEFLLAYHSIATSGSDTIPGFDLNGGLGFLDSRLDLNVLDLDYGSREFSLGPDWDMKWRVGARLASVFFDSQATGFFLEQRVRNRFEGAGPHLGLDLWRFFGRSGLGLFTRLEGAVVLGDVKQTFAEAIGPQFTGVTIIHEDQAVPVLSFQAGLGWTPCWSVPWLRFAAGYEIEQWWSIGRAAGSNADLTAQGLFFRAEWRF